MKKSIWTLEVIKRQLWHEKTNSYSRCAKPDTGKKTVTKPSTWSGTNSIRTSNPNSSRPSSPSSRATLHSEWPSNSLINLSPLPCPRLSPPGFLRRFRILLRRPKSHRMHMDSSGVCIISRLIRGLQVRRRRPSKDPFIASASKARYLWNPTSNWPRSTRRQRCWLLMKILKSSEIN